VSSELLREAVSGAGRQLSLLAALRSSPGRRARLHESSDAARGDRKADRTDHAALDFCRRRLSPRFC